MLSLQLHLRHLFGRIAQPGDPQGYSGLNRQLATLLGCVELPRRADFARLRPALRWAIAGLASCIGLVLTVAVAAIISLKLSTMTFPIFGLGASAESAVETRTQRNFENILQRPLFSRSRQATTAAAPMPALPVAARSRNIVLKGVFITGTSSKAFLTSEQNPLGIWVDSDGEIAGWRMVSVKPDQVVLRAQADELVVALGNFGASGNPPEMPLLPHRGGGPMPSIDRFNGGTQVRPEPAIPGRQTMRTKTAPALQGSAR
jgi:hypothetical protein